MHPILLYIFLTYLERLIHLLQDYNNIEICVLIFLVFDFFPIKIFHSSVICWDVNSEAGNLPSLFLINNWSVTLTPFIKIIISPID